MRLFGRRTGSRNKTANDKQLSFCRPVILSRPLSPLQKWGRHGHSRPFRAFVPLPVNFRYTPTPILVYHFTYPTARSNTTRTFLFYIDTASRCRLAVVPRLICIAFGSLIYTDRTGLENITKKGRAPVSHNCVTLTPQNGYLVQ